MGQGERDIAKGHLKGDGEERGEGRGKRQRS